jgi:hypothetical protein
MVLLLYSVKHPFTQQRKPSSAISLPFDELQLRHVSLNHAITDPPSQASSHCIFVFLDPGGKGLEFGKLAAGYLGQPDIEGVSGAVA